MAFGVRLSEISLGFVFACLGCTGNHAFKIYKKSKGVVEYTVSRYPARTYGEGIRWVDLAKSLGVNGMSVVGWEKGWHLPCRRYRERLDKTFGMLQSRAIAATQFAGVLVTGRVRHPVKDRGDQHYLDQRSRKLSPELDQKSGSPL